MIESLIKRGVDCGFAIAHFTSFIQDRIEGREDSELFSFAILLFRSVLVMDPKARNDTRKLLQNF